MMLAISLFCWAAPSPARAVDVSQPAMLQMFEAKWDTMEDRMADIFHVGYGQLWLPPPQKAGGGQSVGYDVFDRFDLGGPRNQTLYGTQAGLKAMIDAAHRASMRVYTDFIPNHNGFANAGNTSFAAAGGYPGFVFSAHGAPFGDYHDPSVSYQVDSLNGSLFGLIDIAHEQNIQLIRHPVVPNDPANIPAGTIYNRPDPNNARFYPDRDLGGVVLTDSALGGGEFTRYSYNLLDPLAGDPVPENATGLLMRNMQYMIQVLGVDGFRIDAARHFPTWVMNYLDNAVFRASLATNFDGSIKPIYMFSEIADGNRSYLQSYIRRDIPNPYGISPADTTVDGNRDAMDFPLFYALRSNLSGNGFQNNFHNIRHAGMDIHDDGLINGSQGVSFVDSHDEQEGFFPYLKNVAYAYTLMLPGQALVYLNAKQFGEGRDFPHDVGGSANPMSNDALGGFHGDAVARLVELRNTHGRGDFHERWINNLGAPDAFSNIYVYERENSAIVGLNSRLDAGFDEPQLNGSNSKVQTGFAPNTVLVELTGNAANPTVDPGANIPETIRVDAAGKVSLRVPRSSTHGQGYVVYGLATPQGTLTLSNVSQVLPGAAPSLATNGTARLADIDVITADSFQVSLATTPVTLAAPSGESLPYRDFAADGDEALLRIDGGMDLNPNPGIDHNVPGHVTYAFESFTDIRTPGYIDNGSGVNIGSGAGLYQQTIDATRLAEGRHYVTVRAFRHRPDGGPPVFTDFKRTVYIDRLKPVSEIASFAPFASTPGNPNNRDLVVRSVDQTAAQVHVFLDLPPNFSDAQVLQMVHEQNSAEQIDRDQFIYGFTNLVTGNHVATVVTIEPTGNTNVQRLPGLFTDTNIGLGFGDTSGNGVISTNEILGSGALAFSTLLYSQGAMFHAAADVDGDGVITNLDLFDLRGHLVAAGASAAVMNSYDQLLTRRGDVTGDNVTDAADIAALYAGFGGSDWLRDLNVDGTVDTADVDALVTQLVRTSLADFNLDRRVDGADFLIWQSHVGSDSARFDQGDANLDGRVTADDLAIWHADVGLAGPLAAAASTAVPEPHAALLGATALASIFCWRSRHAGRITALPIGDAARGGATPPRQSL